MSFQNSMIAQMFILFILLNLNFVLSVKRDQKHNSTLHNNSIHDTERDGRQFSPGYGPGFGPGIGSGIGGDYGLGTFGGPIEAIIIGLLVVAGFGIIGIPFFLLILTFFNGGGGLGSTGGLGGLGGGLNLVPTTTTTVAGRKRRALNSLLPDVNPLVQQKLFNIFENFIQTPDKIKLIARLMDSMVGQN